MRSTSLCNRVRGASRNKDYGAKGRGRAPAKLFKSAVAEM